MTNKEMIQEAIKEATTAPDLIKFCGPYISVRDIYIQVKAMFGVMVSPEEIKAELVGDESLELFFKKKA